MKPPEDSRIPRFDRGFVSSPQTISRIGEGQLGGKALGLIHLRNVLESEGPHLSSLGLRPYVPKMVVITTEVFDAFMGRNRLEATAREDRNDDRIAETFLKGEFPAQFLGDLRALVEEVRSPLAVRSSSLLEDALSRPFAGVYGTKMVPNNQPDADTRFLRLVEAIKFVFASTFFRAARNYLRSTDQLDSEEKMAVVIQEVVGDRYSDRFYPAVSGVARSYNFFPSGGAAPDEGVVNLALGLGKTIVDGGITWVFSPSRPKAPPPFKSIRDALRNTQNDFWGVNMGRPPAYDPLIETEYLVREQLSVADYDGVLRHVASTYDSANDRFVPGTGLSGPRIVDFAPLLKYSDLYLAETLGHLLSVGEKTLGEAVEIEFAMTLPGARSEDGRLGLLQLRPMLVSEEQVSLEEQDLTGPRVLLSSKRVMGNGTRDSIRDVVYVKPENFEARDTQEIASELEEVNAGLSEDDLTYVLIGFGRWGSSDPWLGIPVDWGQISRARVIVEAALPGMDVEPSQGAHFFHNILSFRVFYLGVAHGESADVEDARIDWEWLRKQPIARETEHVRHIRAEEPLRVCVDGRSGRGAIWHP